METNINAKMLGDLFDQIYIINLPERTDRKNEISVQLEKVGLSFSDPLLHLFPAVRPESKGAFPSIGARGCFMSHLGVLEHATTAHHNSILILEDDVDWTPAAVASGSVLLTTLQRTNWTYLHGGLGKDQRDATTVEFHLEELKPEQGILLAHFVGMRGETIARAHSYLMAIVGRPPGSPQGGPMHVDGAYNWLRKDNPEIRGYVCVPSLARQRPSSSDITPNTGLKALPFISHMLALARYFRKRL